MARKPGRLISLNLRTLAVRKGIINKQKLDKVKSNITLRMLLGMVINLLTIIGPNIIVKPINRNPKYSTRLDLPEKVKYFFVMQVMKCCKRVVLCLFIIYISPFLFDPLHLLFLDLMDQGHKDCCLQFLL